jgi:cysteine-rich repeat protein
MSVKTFFQKRSVRVGAVIVAVVAIGVVASMKSTSMKGSISSQTTSLPVQACFYTATPVTIINKRLVNSGYKSDYTISLITKDSRSSIPLVSESRTIKRETEFYDDEIQKSIDIRAKILAQSKGYIFGNVKCNRTTMIPQIDDDSNNITVSVVSDMPDTISPSQRISYTFRVTNNGQNYANRIPVYFEYNFGYGEPHSLFEESSLPDGCELEKDAGIFGVPLQCVFHLEAGKSQEFTITLTAPNKEIVKKDFNFCGRNLDLKLYLLSYYTRPGEMSIPIKAPKISCPQCGNGIQEGAEVCDDGNQSNFDNCPNSCQAPVCGNNVQERGEECDHGKGYSPYCSNVCKSITPPQPCGNGIREAGEDCDDGNKADGDGCNAQCEKRGAFYCDAPFGQQTICTPRPSNSGQRVNGQ